MDCYFLINYSSLRIRGELILTTPKKDLIPNLDYIIKGVSNEMLIIYQIEIKHENYNHEKEV